MYSLMKCDSCKLLQIVDMSSTKVEPRCRECHGLTLLQYSQEIATTEEEFKNASKLIRLIPLYSGRMYEPKIGPRGVACEYPWGTCKKGGSHVLHKKIKEGEFLQWYMCKTHAQEIIALGPFFELATAKEFATKSAKVLHEEAEVRSEAKAPSAKVVSCNNCKEIYVHIDGGIGKELMYVSRRCPKCNHKDFKPLTRSDIPDEKKKFVKRLFRKAKILSEGKVKKRAFAYQKRIQLFWCTSHQRLFAWDDRNGEKPKCPEENCKNISITKFKRKNTDVEVVASAKVLQRQIRRLNKRGLPLTELGKKHRKGRQKRDKFIPRKCPDGRAECAWKVCKFYFVTIGGKGRSTPVCGKMHPEKMRMHMLKITQRKYKKKAGTYHIRR